eukprot:9069868-Pyramimonas_sp.AAC.1
MRAAELIHFTTTSLTLSLRCGRAMGNRTPLRQRRRGCRSCLTRAALLGDSLRPRDVLREAAARRRSRRKHCA